MEEEKNITLAKEQYDALISRLNNLEKNNELLITIADKKALSQYYQRHQAEIPKKVSLREIDGKVVLGWKSIRDEVYFDASVKAWREFQDVRVVFEDGTTAEMSLVDFTRKYKLISCQRTGIIKDEKTGSVAFKLLREDNGKEYTIADLYVN